MDLCRCLSLLCSCDAHTACCVPRNDRRCLALELGYPVLHGYRQHSFSKLVARLRVRHSVDKCLVIKLCTCRIYRPCQVSGIVDVNCDSRHCEASFLYAISPWPVAARNRASKSLRRRITLAASVASATAAPCGPRTLDAPTKTEVPTYTVRGRSAPVVPIS